MFSFDRDSVSKDAADLQPADELLPKYVWMLNSSVPRLTSTKHKFVSL